MKSRLLFFIIVPREVFGSEGRLIEILNEEDQEVAVELIRAVEALLLDISYQSIFYWWTGLQDADDDRVWTWIGSNFILLRVALKTPRYITFYY